MANASIYGTGNRKSLGNLHYTMEFDAAVHGPGSYEHLDYDLRPEISAETKTLALIVSTLKLTPFLFFFPLLTTLSMFPLIFFLALFCVAGQITFALRENKTGLLLFASILVAIDLSLLLFLISSHFIDRVSSPNTKDYGLTEVINTGSAVLTVCIFAITLAQLFVIIKTAKPEQQPGIPSYEHH